MMGWVHVSEFRPSTGLFFIPQVIYGHGESWWWWDRLGITPHSTTRTLWQCYQQRHLVQLGWMDKGVRILPIQYLRYLKGSLTCRKFLQHGTSGFTSHPKEDVLRIFIALKNPSRRLVRNTRRLSPVAITLTTTLPRRLYNVWTHTWYNTISIVEYILFNRCWPAIYTKRDSRLSKRTANMFSWELPQKEIPRKPHSLRTGTTTK
jgi:hypothetical protein